MLYHYDIAEETTPAMTEDDEPRTSYRYEEVRFLESDDKGALFKKAIADKYSLEQELKMLNESVLSTNKVVNTDERKAYLAERLRIQAQIETDWTTSRNAI